MHDISGFAERGMTILFYMLLFAGVLMISEDSFKTLRLFLVSRKRLRKREKKKRCAALLHCDRLVLAAFGKEEAGKALLLASAFAGTAAMLLCAGKAGAAALLAAFFMGASAPWILLWIRLENVRVRGNEEGEWFMAELLGKYRIAGFNMDLALESIVNGRKKKSICYDQCENVLSAMRKSGEREELFACGEAFRYAIGSGWAGMLAYNLGQAAAEGSDVTAGLEDVIEQLREGKKLAEERKRLNGETGRLVLFMVPFSYVVTLVFAAGFLGGIGNFMENQFGNAVGIMLFLGTIFMFLINILIVSIVRVRTPNF